MYRPLLVLLALVALLLPLSATAQNVKLKNLGASTTGTQTYAIDDLGKQSFFFAVEILFNTAGPRTFTAVIDGQNFKGKLKQSGTDNRKIAFDLKKTSRTKLRRLLESSIEDIGGFDDVDIDDFDIEKLKGKVNKDRDSFKIKGLVEFVGDADGEDGRGDWKFTVKGPLVPVTVTATE